MNLSDEHNFYHNEQKHGSPVNVNIIITVSLVTTGWQFLWQQRIISLSVESLFSAFHRDKAENSRISVDSSVTMKDGEIIGTNRAERAADLIKGGEGGGGGRNPRGRTRLDSQRHVSLTRRGWDTFTAQAVHVDALEKSPAASYWFWTNTMGERDWHNDTRSSSLPTGEQIARQFSLRCPYFSF